ncbi:hypothetical protein [Bacillus dakarensis]|uniref:hypothetical protein n=1 Tax=Robertmurraya dakarensis TaxID=1926278 RepID=UPI0009822ECA|nr:hypothetical protein [Bacillus dakarensis]
MYLRKDINNLLTNREQNKAGPDTMRFKYIKEDPLTIKGKIVDVGIDFVEILQDDHLIISVLTDRITHIKWPGQWASERVLQCKHHGNCHCVQIGRLSDFNDRREKKRKKDKEFHHSCKGCNKTPCQCYSKNHRGVKHTNKRKKFDELRHDHCPQCHHEHREKHDRCPHCHHEHRERHDHCPHCHDEHDRRYDYSEHFYHMRNNRCCHQKFTCFCDHAIPFCDERFELRLAGLNDDLKFKLLQHKGCKVEIQIG